MKELAKIRDGLHKLSFILNREQKIYAVILFIMSCISAVLEMLGVSAIVPLMSSLLDIDSMRRKPYVQTAIRYLHIDTDLELVAWICAGVILLYVAKNIFSTIYLWATTKYTCKLQRELAIRVLHSYMRQGYIFFVNHNSAELLRGVGADVSSTYNIISQLFTLIVKSLSILAIGIYVFVESPMMAIIIGILMVICFLITQMIFRRSMRTHGTLIRKYEMLCNQATLELVQGSKEVLALNRQEYFVDKYEKNMLKLNRSTIREKMGAGSPAFLIEAVCISGILTTVAVQMGMSANPYEMVTQLSAIAVGVFRILPALGAVMSCVNVITFYAPALNAAYDTFAAVKDMEKRAKEEEKVSQTPKIAEKAENWRELVIRGLGYHYPNVNKDVIHDLDLTIKRGSSVAFIGSSGSGKTTLVDLILDLLKPQEGEICLDDTPVTSLGNKWHQVIGYVPQFVYMTDASLRQNIAFGVEEDKIDDDRVWKALEMAQLTEVVKALPDQLDTMLGERGTKLSGGQRQRVAIARALYNDPDIIVFDEATASLDNETERAVMESIDALQGLKTLIIVAHRLSTIAGCDHIYAVENGVCVEKSRAEVFGDQDPGKEASK